MSKIFYFLILLAFIGGIYFISPKVNLPETNLNQSNNYSQNDSVQDTNQTVISNSSNQSINQTMPPITYIPPKFYITLISNGGEILPNNLGAINLGESKTFNVIPLKDYFIDKWYVDNVFVQSGGNYYTLNNISRNMTVSVTFTYVPSYFSIIASADSGGIVNPSGTFTRNKGEPAYFQAQANQGYFIDKWYVDGIVTQTGYSANERMVLYNIQSNHIVRVTFRYVVNDVAIEGVDFKLLSKGRYACSQLEFDRYIKSVRDTKSYDLITSRLNQSCSNPLVSNTNTEYTNNGFSISSSKTITCNIQGSGVWSWMIITSNGTLTEYYNNPSFSFSNPGIPSVPTCFLEA